MNITDRLRWCGAFGPDNNLYELAADEIECLRKLVQLKSDCKTCWGHRWIDDSHGGHPCSDCADSLINDAADYLAATMAKTDQRAWDSLLTYAPAGPLFNALLKKVNFDTFDPASFTLGELERAIEGARLPSYSETDNNRGNSNMSPSALSQADGGGK
jgi:hypothetical protein